LPIDLDFMNKLEKHGNHNGHDVWGEVKPPEKLGIHGTNVAVDHEICSGDAICVNVCPVNVFEMVDSPGYPISNTKSDPVRESDCIFCLACEASCPVKAIKITQK
jgi:NAD-dependent dihydropyrimidine dehydrogenase PreA subunit